MKKATLTLAFVVLTTIAFGQITKPDTTKREFKNIIELDATGLLHQFFFTSGTATNNIGTPYMISYKRFFKSNSIRFGVGGKISTNYSKMNDSIIYSSKRNSFNVGLGIEHYCYLTKRWNFYFGVDAIANYSETETVQDKTPTHSFKQTQTNYEYGVSPLSGIQFKINPRMSISTETRFDIVYTLANQKRNNTPQTSFTSVYETKGHGMQTTFNLPLNINFRVHF